MLETSAPGHTVSPKRELSRRDVKRALYAAIARTNTTTTAVGAALGISAQRVQKMTDVDQPNINLTVADAICLPEATYDYILEFIAEKRDRRVYVIPNLDSMNEDLRIIAEAHKQTSEAIAILFAALIDNKISADEAMTALKEVQQAQAALASLEELLVRIIAERGTEVER